MNFSLPKPSQIFFKIQLKSMSQKPCDFSSMFLKKCFVARVPTSISCWFFQYKMALGRFSSNSFSHPYSVQNTYQKTSQNEVRAMKKSMLNMCCFLTSIFRVWASILKPLGPPTWSQVGHLGLKILNALPFWILLN